MYKRLTKEVVVEEVFDDYGRILSRKDMDGETIWTYNDAGKLLEKSLNGTILETNHYDSKNRLVYAYDMYDESITEIEYNSNGKYESIIEYYPSYTVEHSFKYDDLGREILIEAKVISPKEEYTMKCETSYNEDGSKIVHNLNDDTISKYDKDENEIYSLEYDKISEKYIEIISEFNNQNKIISREGYSKTDKESKDKELVSKVNYEYDENGNLIKSVSGSYIKNYEYDDNNRCIHIYDSDGSEQWFDYIEE